MEIKDAARAALRALPDDVRRQIGCRLHPLQQDSSGDVKKLKGSKNEYRLRVGGYRMLFELDGPSAAWFILLGGERTSANKCLWCKTQKLFRPIPGSGLPDCRGQGRAP